MIRPARAVLAFGVCVALLWTAALPAAAQSTMSGWSPDLMFQVKRVGPVVPSPDASHVAFVVSEAITEGEKSEWLSHVHVARADGSGQFQLTRGDKSATRPRWSPDGRWIGFISSRAGKANVFRIRLEGGEAEQLTDEKGGVSDFDWSPDGRSIAFVMTEPKSDAEEKADKEKRDARVVDENEKFANLYVAPVEKNADGKRASTRLTSPRVHVTAFDWSPDGTRLVVAQADTPKVFAENDIAIVRVDGGDPRTLAATGADEQTPVFSPDGRSIAFTASDDPPTWAFTARVQVMPADGGQGRPLAPSFDEQPNIVGWAADGRGVYVQETHGTLNRLSLLPLDGTKPVEVSPSGVNLTNPTMNRERSALGFVQTLAATPPEPFVASLPRFEARQAATVQSLSSGDAAAVGRTEVISWKASDGQAIEGLVTYPVGYQRGQKVPLLVVVHGGPTGVFTQAFVGMPSQYPIPIFAARGFAVLRCNVRGSSGYGRAFRYANYQDWGGGDYRDIMSGVDHVIAQGVADPDRLGIMGWSYGGYMTSWVITQTKRFKAASVGAGVTNLVSFTGTADIPGFIPDYFGGEFWDVLDLWRARSAVFNVKGVTTPTLIQHGEEDRRVPVSQGYELYNALLRQGVPVKMVVYPRQPHGIQEPKLLKDAMERNLEWFERWVLREGKTTSDAAQR